MPLDQSFVGRTYPPTSSYAVDRGNIREFAESIRDGNALYLDPAAARAAGYPDVIAPPTFLTVMSLPAINQIAKDPELGLDYSRMVHGDQSFSYTRAVHAGDELRLTTWVENIMARAGNDFLNLRTDISTVDGELVCTARMQLVVRGAEEKA